VHAREVVTRDTELLKKPRTCEAGSFGRPRLLAVYFTFGMTFKFAAHFRPHADTVQ
jgi:hypothetical protein